MNIKFEYLHPALGTNARHVARQIVTALMALALSLPLPSHMRSSQEHKVWIIGEERYQKIYRKHDMHGVEVIVVAVLGIVIIVLGCVEPIHRQTVACEYLQSKGSNIFPVLWESTAMGGQMPITRPRHKREQAPFNIEADCPIG
ncbi:MAG TPA: hypothetical protein PKN33_08940 [Phycisphaerae bacterium]|nr:hypothetical protein [Phycisphaerae bacterium]